MCNSSEKRKIAAKRSEWRGFTEIYNFEVVEEATFRGSSPRTFSGLGGTTEVVPFPDI
jgi:hypothetical protein